MDRLNMGESNAQIALALYLSERTVRDHVGRMLTKLGAESRLQAVLTARQLGIAHAPDTLSGPALAVLSILQAYPEAIDELEAAGALRWGNGDPNGT